MMADIKSLLSVGRPDRRGRIRRRRPRAVRMRGPNTRSIRAVELWYKSELIALIDRCALDVKSRLVPQMKRMSSQWTGDGVLVGDGYKSELEEILEGLSTSFGQIRDTAKSLSDLAAKRTLAASDDSLKAALKRSVGVDVTALLGHGAISGQLEDATVANIELIKSIPTKYLEGVKSVVYESTARGLRWESIVGAIEEKGKVAKSRAKLIARDQVSKMNGSFNMARQTSLGIEKYTWQTSGDERVRASHRNNDGKMFRWDKPPATGHPGHDVQCRCVAIPYLEI